MIKKIIRTIMWILIILLLLFSLYVIFNKVILKKKIVNVFGYSYMVVKSNSMYPTIKVNDVIIIKITKDINDNDIITYEEDNIFVTHRVAEIEDNKITTKGDNNNTSDEPFDISNVVGKVVKII